MANTGLITEQQLQYIDTVVYQPNQATLTGRSLFSSVQMPNAWTRSYTYHTMTGTAKAAKYVNRGTDIPTVDASMGEDTAYLTAYDLAATYSFEELEEATAAHLDLLNIQAQLVSRGMAEKENQIIFNGEPNSNPKMDIKGLTDDWKDLKIQEIQAPDTFANLTAADSNGNTQNMKLYNWFRAAVGKIHALSGYETAKPVLALPQEEMDMLSVAFNEYNPSDTVLNMINSMFSRVVTVPEFGADHFGGKTNKADMGMIFMNTPREAVIADAVRMRRLTPEYRNFVTRVPYLSRHSGVIIRYPSAFVRLDGIGTRTGSGKNAVVK